MTLEVRSTDVRLVTARTRFPFEFGIATMTKVPHCFVTLSVNIDGDDQTGIAADSFPPRWLTKDPELPLEDEVQMILEVVETACKHATGVTGETVFECWRKIHGAQQKWATSTQHPPLLWNFGVAFVERALVDAFCRVTGQPFPEAVRENSLGLQPELIYPELEGEHPDETLPDEPNRSVAVRHTVGHSDPLREADNRPDDDLPLTLEENITTYGLDRFKLKVAGDPASDVKRVRAVLSVLEDLCEEYRFTLDANEQYGRVDRLETFLDRAADVPGFEQNLLFIEQPFPRNITLTDNLSHELAKLEYDHPIVIDESDGELDTFGQALELGYDGTSHKNCKGLFKGIANAMLAARRRDRGETALLTGEDLTTIGPVALHQDLAAMATLGIDHVERNGHHYFRGLEMFPPDLQNSVLDAHGDMYRELPDGTAALAITGGRIRLDSVLRAPFGYACEIDTGRFAMPTDWMFEPS